MTTQTVPFRITIALDRPQLMALLRGESVMLRARTAESWPDIECEVTQRGIVAPATDLGPGA